MPEDFDKVTISVGAKQVIALEANLEEHGAPVGGEIVVRATDGGAFVAIRAADPEHGSTELLLRDGAVVLFSHGGERRVTLSPTREMADGGLVLVHAPDDPDGPAPDGSPAPSAIALDAAERSLVISSSAGVPLIRLDGATGDVSAGDALRFIGAEGQLVLGAKGNGGILRVKSSKDEQTISLDGETGAIRAGATIQILPTIGEVRIGGVGGDGALLLGNQGGDNTIRLDGTEGQVLIGDVSNPSVDVEGGTGAIRVGGNGTEGSIQLFQSSSWGAGRDAKASTIWLDGQTGDIKLSAAGDCAEEFATVGGAPVEPGSVLVIDDHDALAPCAAEYDRRVAGVVSGAGDLRPGITLNAKAPSPGRAPVALVGKVHCRVDAGTTGVRAGDLLTTSATPGHAMPATDPARSPGAILGKALGSLAAGTGTIPILVSLQ
ncbi:MAG TPA: hypothetical protein VHF89_11180 [Solirubrobacteraceae bacterium]|nr:hypothetical protein [Solirubrobacteraceae bacterium]